ncbi:nuclear transport factor 2 family protein [Conexibacter sp. SYSU D00693]|uniref:nuclear transport factor 2 family protein n=1 Tax=Conexibacter sp. SYSU D00693 TaxID=2812560 RepID=UPI00196A3884|nr:nuclear transport factor 2 family protein [Conexibacter sp. SYSU D00693]
MQQTDVHAAYRAAMEAGDPEAVKATLAPDITFHSPVTPKPFVGRDAAGHVLANILEVFEDLRFTAELAGGDQVAIVFEARIGDRDLQGIDLLTFDDDGLISEFRVLVRPLTGVVAIQNAMAPRFGSQPVVLTTAG